MKDGCGLSSLDDGLKLIEHSREDIVQFMVEMLKIKAVNPDGGGKGEYDRALFIQKWLENLGCKVTRHEVPDNRSQKESGLI